MEEKNLYRELLDLRKGFSNRILFLIITMTAFILTSIPFFVSYAASSSYSFYMIHNVVNGCNNGTYHYLDSGTVSISGNTTTSSSQQIMYNLKRQRFGIDKNFGTVTRSPNMSFYGTFPTAADANSSDYCLIVSRVSTDPWAVSGSGVLSN